MDLFTYRKNQSLTLAALAGRLGCTEATLSRYETGSRRPDLEMIAKIEAETDGAVTYRDWLREASDPEAA